MCNPLSETNSTACCLGSCVPEGAADTTTNFVFTNFVLLSTETPTLPVQQDMILIRLLHRITSCRPEADDSTAFLCPNTRQTQTCDKNCTTSFRNTHHKHCTEPWRNDISSFFPLGHSSPTVLASSAASEPQSHGAFRAVVSCSVPRS